MIRDSWLPITATVHKALADAVDAELIARDPAERAKPPQPSKQTSAGIQAWASDELQAFLSHVKDSRLAAIWRISAMTGMRRSEILGPRWSDLDVVPRAYLYDRHSSRSATR